jgi:mannose-6-phosphate isomerase-like protein (cupin superfamily)
MKIADVQFEPGFHVLTGNGRSQAALMVIEPGERGGGADNLHKGADQWLYVESGEGQAKINGEVFAIAKGSLVLIEHGDRHEIRNELSISIRHLLTPMMATSCRQESQAEYASEINRR